MRSLLLLLALLTAATPSFAQEKVLAIPSVKKMEDLKWTLLFPELGAKSPRIATLRTDPRTKSTAVLLRFPGPFHIPLHWHSSSESQMIVKGHVTVDLNGVRSELERGDFNYVPAKMPHESWTGKEGALIYIHSDGPWDFDWVDRPPNPRDLVGKPPRVEKKDED